MPGLLQVGGIFIDQYSLPSVLLPISVLSRIHVALAVLDYESQVRALISAFSYILSALK